MDRALRPEDFVGQPLPDLSLTSPDGSPYPIRQHLDRAPQVLFFVVRSGTPG
jgi:hypothetical protein